MNQSFKDGGFVHGAEEPQKPPLPGEAYKIAGSKNTTPAGSPVPIEWMAVDAEDVAALFEARYLEYAANWRRICQALDKHHPQWIDGNGSAIDKVVKFIEEVKS